MVIDFMEEDALPEDYVVKFWAGWCIPCSRWAPFFEEASGESDLPFYAVDVDRHPRVARDFGVRGIPSAFVVRGGRRERIDTVASAQGILEQIK